MVGDAVEVDTLAICGCSLRYPSAVALARNDRNQPYTLPEVDAAEPQLLPSKLILITPELTRFCGSSEMSNNPIITFTAGSCELDVRSLAFLPGA